MSKWSETHAMFAYMGGFRFVNKNGSKENPREDVFFLGVLNGEIDTPDIAVEDILDKSKADGIAKAIVLIQTLWFALQVLNRLVQHLPVTELEITTLAHVTINVFTYWCWWNKPLDVKRPIDIYPRNDESQTKEQSSERLGDNNVDVAPISEGVDGDLLGDNNVDVAQRNEEVERYEGASGHLLADNNVDAAERNEEVERHDGADDRLLGDNNVDVAQRNEEVERYEGADDHLLADNVDAAERNEEVERHDGADDHLLGDINVDVAQRNEEVERGEGADGHLLADNVDAAERNEEVERYEAADDPLLGDNNVDVAQRNEEVERDEGADGHLLADNVDAAERNEEVERSDGVDCHLLGDNNVDVAQRNEEIEISERADGHLLADEKAQTVRPRLSIRVRMGAFFANSDGHYMGSRSGPVLAILSGTFGGIHCLAWNSTFHTQVESSLWRACALLVATLPFMLFSGGAMAEGFHVKISSLKGKGRTLAIIGSMFAVLRNTTLLLGFLSYVFARICLLVLAIRALKTLPEKALLVPSWAQYIPHV
ncbi:hypothetical protein APHAL10511_004069 [Amanita phalloides]|nr:hypothetical protein APHAL10511_004069 [Amanita phalloides]